MREPFHGAKQAPLKGIRLSDIDTFLRCRDVVRVTGMSRSQVYRLVDLDQFPRPIKLSERSVAWSSAEIEKWQRSRMAKRDGAA
jgi:prophage regulatory protein